MNDKILSNYELLCTELVNVISTLEIAISDINPQTDKAEENTTAHVQERYGAYVWLAGKKFN